MLIYQGVKIEDIDSLVSWPVNQGDIIVSRAWSLTESARMTYRNIVEVSKLKDSPNPEYDATIAITNALEMGARLMKIGFAPTTKMIEEIVTSFGS